ncbi:MAG: hypothetical protein PHO44_03980 [Sphaerochaetaceae bacterium]|jgi:hypothetical protein|nr:hypothetical protein [Sphaerochaetaceae bacterium]MDD3162893.1 hypothetical protein [Sphaerochaetaceae bacterium]MDD4007120.1 hypothetical protein [Sphaerochaetaceae bacterium]MDD4396775.1 hypothetical protein [Sphaerochaetaceae bacterium]
MGATKEDLLAANLFFKAVFPVMQVLLDDDPKIHKSFEDVAATVQIGAFNDSELMACHLIFDHGKIQVVQGPAENPDLKLTFKTIDKMNTMFRGGMALPGMKFKSVGLLIKVLSLLMGLKLMMPNSKPKDLAGKTLKVKLSLYMITRALSVYNKEGNPDMVSWTTHQPDRIYQFIVEPYEETKVACYLRVKAGKTKSGHGIYERRTPFVLFHFFSVDGALKVLGKEVAFVEGVEKHCVETVGSPEYACQLNDFMAVLQAMLT